MASSEEAQVSAKERKTLNKAVSSYKAGRKASTLRRWMASSEGGYYTGEGDGVGAANEHYKLRLKNSGWESPHLEFLLAVFKDGWSHEESGAYLDLSKTMDHQSFNADSDTYLARLRAS